MVQQIHEILCIIIKLYATAEVEGTLLPTSLFYDIAKFTETLQTVFTSLKTQQSMGKIKWLLKQASFSSRLQTCNFELNHSLEKFRVQLAGSMVSQMSQMHRDAQQQHEELLALLAAHPDLSNSDCSSVTGTILSLSNSSSSLSLLPPSPKIFYGRESELEKVINILIQDSARIALLGAGGMGKTSLAAAALHSSQVEVKYSQRYFIRCHSAPTCSELVSSIADHIGVEKGANLSKKILHHFTHAPACLLVLDNFETAWESLNSRPSVEEFLSLLTDIPHLGLMITLRGSERPSKVKWSRPFLTPLSPLSGTAAFQTFMDVADDAHDTDSVKQLLDLTGNLPLAVSLIAAVAATEGCEEALSRWKFESTQMLSDGYDQRSSLDISIMLSFTSPRMTSGAQDLLSILSMLPNGFTDTDLVQSKLPIRSILACKAVLIQTSLAYVDGDQRVKVLVPIREHILRAHPPTAELKLHLREHFHGILSLWEQFLNLNGADIMPKLSPNLGNLHSVLLDALGTESPDSIRSIESILSLNKFYDRTTTQPSPLMEHLRS
ncbi:P-loop containing nucleoside triphosphate hydrolase protein, partial [Mycena rebaudengoi]